MEYYFNEIDPFKFQRLISSILDASIGEDYRVMPQYGADGGRDGETAPSNPYFEYQIDVQAGQDAGLKLPRRKGRYLFQVKHHRTIDVRLTDARRSVLSDFALELEHNVLGRVGSERVNYFFLVTNVPSSQDAVSKLDRIREQLLKNDTSIHADIWWKEKVTAMLDRMPTIWSSFPEIFSGGKVPFVGAFAAKADNPLSRAVKIAIRKQYDRDSVVKFRQIGLETQLSRLFVDLDLNIKSARQAENQDVSLTILQNLVHSRRNQELFIEDSEVGEPDLASTEFHYFRTPAYLSALGVLLHEATSDVPDVRKKVLQKVILEGGPGQGKSTITQMVLQIYRQQLLGESRMDPEGRWSPPQKARLPFRVELREFAEWLSQGPHGSVEQYLAISLNRDSGSDQISAESIHDMMEGSPVLIVFDGLDEIGNDEWRDKTVLKIKDCIDTLEKDLNADARIIITTRPPAIVGRQQHLADFIRLPIAALEPHRVRNYLERWLSVHMQDDEDEKVRIRRALALGPLHGI